MMDAQKKNKRLGWVVLLLIVMNIVSLSALWIGHTNRPGAKRGSVASEKYLQERLGLSEEQLQAMTDLREEHFGQMEKIRRDFLSAREAFHKQPRNENNTARMDDLAARIGSLQAQMEKEVYYHFSAMRDLCTEDQKKIFDEVIEDVLRRGENRGGPRSKGPPPPRPGGHRPPPNGN